MLIVLTCSATGALGAAECQVMKWEMDRSEVKVRAEEKKGQAGKKISKPNSVSEINSLSLFFVTWCFANEPTLRQTLSTFSRASELL